MTNNIHTKLSEIIKRSSLSHLVVLVEAGHGAGVSVVAVCVGLVVREVLLSLVGWMGGHALLHALVDLLLVHRTPAGIDVWLQAHATAEGGGVSCKTIRTYQSNRCQRSSSVPLNDGSTV